jgi:two-component system OmpR family sensor kinase
MRRASLRRRFATWVALAILGSIAIYGVVVYVLVSDEIPKIASGDPTEAGEKGGAEVLESILLAAPIALAGGVAAALILSKRALAPIDDAVATASEITANDLHRRLPVPARDDELRALALALNGLIARMEDGFGALARQAAEASHELRTPLTVIATELEVALRRPRDAAEWQGVGARTLDEIRRLSALVEALLELSRAGAVPAAGGGAVDVVAVAEQVCGGLAGAAEARGVALDLDACPAAQVRGHGGALEGALRNLVGNALRFTPGGGRVIVRVEQAGEIAIHVDDSGPGVAPDERALVFEPFHRGRAAEASPRDGVGLGLAIVRKVVTAHGGAIAIADSPLGGARFTITLPAGAA